MNSLNFPLADILSTVFCIEDASEFWKNYRDVVKPLVPTEPRHFHEDRWMSPAAMDQPRDAPIPNPVTPSIELSGHPNRSQSSSRSVLESAISNSFCFSDVSIIRLSTVRNHDLHIWYCRLDEEEKSTSTNLGNDHEFINEFISE